LDKVFGYQTSAFRKALSLPKRHDVDALCVAMLGAGEVIAVDASFCFSGCLLRGTKQPRRNENFYLVKFRQRQTRRQYHDLPKKGIGRVRYQVNFECKGFRKGDIVRVKGKWVKQINSIYSNGYLAFARIKGEPTVAKPKDLKLLKRGQCVIWEKAV
jgi:hypothetical protein